MTEWTSYPRMNNAHKQTAGSGYFDLRLGYLDRGPGLGQATWTAGPGYLDRGAGLPEPRSRATWTARPGYLDHGARLPGPRGRATWTAGPEGWAPGVIEPGLEIEKRRRRFHACAIKLCLCHKTFVRPSCSMLCHKGLQTSVKAWWCWVSKGSRTHCLIRLPAQKRAEYSPVAIGCRPIVQHASLNIKRHLCMATDAEEFRVLWMVWICHKNFELSRATEGISTFDLFW